MRVLAVCVLRPLGSVWNNLLEKVGWLIAWQSDLDEILTVYGSVSGFILIVVGPSASSFYTCYVPRVSYTEPIDIFNFPMICLVFI